MSLVLIKIRAVLEIILQPKKKIITYILNRIKVFGRNINGITSNLTNTNAFWLHSSPLAKSSNGDMPTFRIDLLKTSCTGRKDVIIILHMGRSIQQRKFRLFLSHSKNVVTRKSVLHRCTARNQYPIIFVCSFGLQLAKLLKFVDSQEFRETPREEVIEKNARKENEGN